MTAANLRGSWFRAVSLGVLVLSGVACTARKSPAPSTNDPDLDDGVVARVGTASIPAGMVAAVVAAQGVDRSTALDRLIHDALLAEHARTQEAWRPRVSSAERAVLGRVLLERLRAENDAQPVTDAEIRAAAAQQWWEFDRPASVRAIHAVVRFSAAADEPRARGVAEDLRAAVTEVADVAEFKRAALAVEANGLEVKVESLDPVTAEGALAVPGGGRLVEAFAQAAHAIEKEGGTSPITRTDFGYHVIRLVERLPAHNVPLEEARRRLEAAVRGARARESHIALLRELSARDRPVVDRAAVEVTGVIQLEQ